GRAQRAAEDRPAGPEQDLAVDVDAALEPKAAPQIRDIVREHPAAQLQSRAKQILGARHVGSHEGAEQGEDRKTEALQRRDLCVKRANGNAGWDSGTFGRAWRSIGQPPPPRQASGVPLPTFKTTGVAKLPAWDEQ